MSDPVQEYQNALSLLLKHEHQLSKTLSVVHRYSQLLPQWQRMVVQFSNHISGYPDALTLGTGAVILKAEEWPSAERFNELFTTWHKLRREVDQAWEKVPLDRQTGLKSPKEHRPPA